MKSESTLPKTSLQPLEDRVVVKPDLAPEKWGDTNLIVPEGVKEKHKPHTGTIIAVGPGKIGGNSIQIKTLSAIVFICRIIVFWVKNWLTKNNLGEDNFEMPKELQSVNSYHMPLNVGDRVMYGHFAGTPIEDPKTKEKFLVMRLDDVFIKMHETDEKSKPESVTE
jgi:co-chaperonin GroES (HSP10)